VHKLERGLEIYDHSEVTNFSSILKNIVSIFSQWANQRSITIIQKIEDDIYIKALKENDLYDKVWQAAAILLPVQSAS
jgi:hypothetical protein